jgi:ubiquinone/menaquinone biosynthesis C-methylase UbiE
MTYDPDLFKGAAPYYDRYRAPYAVDAIDFVVDRLRLDGEARLIDLGCGPGTLARRLASRVKEVIAMDPDAEMLAEGQRLAASEGVYNINWKCLGSADLNELTGPYGGAVMGQSFHWMDRDQVLRDFHRLIEERGKIALINPGRRRPQESWEPIAARIIENYLGSPKIHRQRNSEPHHEAALKRSAFRIIDDIEFSTMIDRDIPSILGAIYSSSSSTPRYFGGRQSDFEHDLEVALRQFSPSGRFHETIETGVLIAERSH